MMATSSSVRTSSTRAQPGDHESGTGRGPGAPSHHHRARASCCSMLGIAQRLLPYLFCTNALYAITFLSFVFDLFAFLALVNTIATTWGTGCELYVWFLTYATAQVTRFGAFALFGHRMRALWILPQFIFRLPGAIFPTTYLFFRIFALYVACVSAPLLLYARHNALEQVNACPSSLTDACLWLTAYDLALAIVTLGILLLVRVAVRSQQHARWTTADRVSLATLSWYQLSHPAAWNRPGELAPFTPLSLWLTHIFWPGVLVQPPHATAPAVLKPAPPGLSDHEIALLPICSYKENMLDASRRTCVVCHDEFTCNDVLRVLPCIHHFHRACVDPWLFRRASCPLCVTPITIDCESGSHARGVAGGGGGGGGDRGGGSVCAERPDAATSAPPQHSSITIRHATGASDVSDAVVDTEARAASASDIKVVHDFATESVSSNLSNYVQERAALESESALAPAPASSPSPALSAGSVRAPSLHCVHPEVALRDSHATSVTQSNSPKSGNSVFAADQQGQVMPAGGETRMAQTHQAEPCASDEQGDDVQNERSSNNAGHSPAWTPAISKVVRRDSLVPQSREQEGSASSVCRTPSHPLPSARRPPPRSSCAATATEPSTSEAVSHTVQSSQGPRQAAHVRFSIQNQLITLPSSNEERYSSRVAQANVDDGNESESTADDDDDDDDDAIRHVIRGPARSTEGSKDGDDQDGDQTNAHDAL